MASYQELAAVFEKYSHLGQLQAICGWDEAVMMPVGAGEARCEALATMQAVRHELIAQDNVGELLELVQNDMANLDDWQRANVCWMQKRYIDATLLPAHLVSALTKASITCEQAWRTCRPANDWHGFLPFLENVVALVRESAQIRSEHWGLSTYDMLLDDSVPGFNQATISPLFNELENQLPLLLSDVMSYQKSFDVKPLKGSFDIPLQKQLGLDVMKLLGFDFNHGRLDIALHPFCGGTPRDVRITTRYDSTNFLSALMGVCHETGHGRYEFGLPERWLSQPVGEALGMAMHESQSLLVEMEICRSQAFMQLIEPLVKQYFGEHESLSANNLWHQATQVSPGLIRVDADEVSYPLHVILRYKIEQQLFDGQLAVSDLPEMWDAAMQQYMGLSTKGNMSDGVMQDVHWPSGAFGYFPAYTLGRVIAAQVYDAMLQDVPQREELILAGELAPIFSWLKEHIYSKASSLPCDQLLYQATGSSLSVSHFMEHLKARYLGK